MKLPFELVLLLTPALSAPLTPRSATFPHLRGLTTLPRDYSSADTRFPKKYFHEATYHPHYDGRFAASVLPREARLFHMRLLLRSYMAAMQRIGVRTWIMHGSLLAWWWNGQLFPWDSDLDVCVEEEGMAWLGGWWNMTVHHFSAAELGLDLPSDEEQPMHRDRRKANSAEDEPMQILSKPPNLIPAIWTHVLTHGKKYLLEINPHHTDPSTSDTFNVIDARWIDTATGLFIDITTLHPVPGTGTAKSASKHQIFLDRGDEGAPQVAAQDTHPARPAEMFTKDTHLYSTAALFPLRRTRFEGVGVSVPYAYETLLLEEYGRRGLTETWFNGYAFEKGRGWVVQPVPPGGSAYSREKGWGKGKMGSG